MVALERLLQHSNATYSQIRQTEAAGGFDLALIRRFVREIKTSSPDLIHVRGLGNEGFHGVLAARIAGVPIILVSVHGTQRDIVAPASPVRRWIVANILEPLTLGLATHIATVSEAAAQRDFITSRMRRFVGTVSNGVVTCETPHRDPAFRARWGLPAAVPLAVSVSRVTREKGYEVLADALKQMDGSVPPFALMVVGCEDGGRTIRRRFDGLTSISVAFAGHQANVESFLAESDFFVLPSLHENLSNALLEAMACGLPAVATAVGGNVEVLTRGGGLLVPPGDSSALAEAIGRVVREPMWRTRTGIEARDVVGQYYSVNHMVSGWEKIYERLLEVDGGIT